MKWDDSTPGRQLYETGTHVVWRLPDCADVWVAYHAVVELGRGTLAEARALYEADAEKHAAEELQRRKVATLNLLYRRAAAALALVEKFLRSDNPRVRAVAEKAVPTARELLADIRDELFSLADGSGSR